MPVVDYYRKMDKVVEVSGDESPQADWVQVDSSPEIAAVYETVRTAIDPRLGITPPKPLVASDSKPVKDSAPAPGPSVTADASTRQEAGDVPVLAKPAV